MSIINRIENRILELDGGAFQKLADAYLYKKGYEHLNPIGSVVGADKVRKGTPDTFVPLPDGKYVLAEYTTQQDHLFDKITDDLDKCFDEKRTGLAVSNISEIVYCHTSSLTLSEEDNLRKQCQARGVDLNVVGVGRMSHELCYRYPGLARDHLGVEVDTGQIVQPEDFVTLYGKGRLATPLSTAFRFREAELRRAVDGIETADVVMITGRAGVGKSRLAMEACKLFVERNSKYSAWCIFNRGVDLYQDLQAHFSEGGNILLFVDDANRISRFDYVLQLLRSTNQGRVVKVIVSVRDYAADKIREAIKPFATSVEVRLAEMSRAEVKQLVEEEFEIRNTLYLDRIAEVSAGNPRLAMMAAHVAKNDALQSLADTSSLYDQYYSTIRQDVVGLEEPAVLQAAGVIAFLRVVDRSNEGVVSDIEKGFGIPFEQFWEAARRLHDFEIVDMYETEVVKIADQVLATYLFYLAVFKERRIDFGTLLRFFPRLRQRLVDAINPILSTFDTKLVMDQMRPYVSRAWEELAASGDEDGLLSLIKVFWFLKPTDCLLYVRNRVLELGTETCSFEAVQFHASSDSTSTPPLVSILSLFKYSEPTHFAAALDLLLEYLGKRPNNAPHVLRVLVKEWGVDQESYLAGFAVQEQVVDDLWRRARQGEDRLYALALLFVIQEFLHTDFEDCSFEGRTVTITQFTLLATPECLSLRKKLWGHLFSLFVHARYWDPVLRVLHDYCHSRHHKPEHDLVVADAQELMPFFGASLDDAAYRHCRIVNDLLDFFEDQNVEYDASLRERYRCRPYIVSELLLDDRAERRELGLGREDYHEWKLDRLGSYLEGFELDDFRSFLGDCVIIAEATTASHEVYQLQTGTADALIVMTSSGAGLCLSVLDHYLGLGDPLNLAQFFPMSQFIAKCGTEPLFRVLSEREYPNKNRWLFRFLSSLPQAAITWEWLQSLYELYERAEATELPRSMDFLLPYQALDSGLIVRVTRLIVGKSQDDPRYADGLDLLFNPYSEVNKRLKSLFARDLDVLEDAYIAHIGRDSHPDHDGHSFSTILDLDPDFMFRYLDWMFKTHERLGRFDDPRDYTFIWRREDYAVIMTRVIGYVYALAGGRTSYLQVFFDGDDDDRARKPDSELVSRQDEVIGALITAKRDDPRFTRYLFSAIAKMKEDRRLRMIAHFLEHNNRFNDFEQLPLEPDSFGWSGSIVPVLERKIRFFESLLDLLRGVALLEHRQYIERRIQSLRDWVEAEKKREFISD